MLCLKHQTIKRSNVVAKSSDEFGTSMEISEMTSSVSDQHQRSTFQLSLMKNSDTSASIIQSVGFGQAGQVEIVKVVLIHNHTQVSVPNMKFIITGFVIILIKITIMAYEYEEDEVPFFAYGDLYISELSSGIHFEFNLSE